MKKQAYQSVSTFDARPLRPLSTEATAWVAADAKARAFRLGMKASLEEVTGCAEAASQRWCWRVCKFGGETGIATSREAGARAAEFALGLGEMPIVLPETKAAKRTKGGAA